jgi:SAM-dependent methyltransferase
MRYDGRPGISPAVAILIANGAIHKDHVILDVGCGTGTDCILLARWGFRHVVGIDPDAEAIRIARARASRLGLNRRLRFLLGRPEDLPTDLPRSAADVVLHTLVGNNLEADYYAHFRSIARAMKPKGLLVACIRTFRQEENGKPNAVPPIAGMNRVFVMSPGVSSHLAEGSRKRPGYAPVAVWLGRPRRRPTPQRAKHRQKAPSRARS